MPMPRHSKPDTLAALAARVNGREKRSRADTLAHAIAQGTDLLTMKELVRAEGGKWEEWADANLVIGKSQRCVYVAFAKGPVTGDADADWERLQTLQGNRKPPAQPKPDKTGATGEPREEEVDDAQMGLLLSKGLADELRPILTALRAEMDVPSVTVELYRQAGKEVARG